MMSYNGEKEITRRLALLPAVFQSIDHQVKVALLRNDCEDLDSFPTTERGWQRLAEKCRFDEGTLNRVRNLVTPLQNQPQCVISFFDLIHSFNYSLFLASGISLFCLGKN